MQAILLVLHRTKPSDRGHSGALHMQGLGLRATCLESCVLRSNVNAAVSVSNWAWGAPLRLGNPKIEAGGT